MKINYRFQTKEKEDRVIEAEWEIEGNDDIRFTTNDRGDGLFEIDYRRGDRRQLEGTLQFSVAGLTKNSARAKIRKYMLEKYF